MRSLSPDARLRAAAGFVRRGARLIDVGTDHAYLPVSLLRGGRISFAVASDIAAGPLAHARETAELAGIGADRLALVQTEGLLGLEAYAPTDVTICGMGGEMIVGILSAAPFVRDPAIRLILQPMSRAQVLRRYLAAEGFIIESEALARVKRHVYTCLCVHYEGVPYSLTPIEAFLGAYYTVGEGRASPLFSAYLSEQLDTVRRRVYGRRSVGAASAADESLLADMEAFL